MGRIPLTIVLGYNDREGTYEQKLGFITSYKTKKRDTLHFESNFHKWRDKKI